MDYDIIIIGAGTSAGFLLAFLDEQEAMRNLKILVLEKTKEPFRKILASGNGRCNFSNTNLMPDAYYSLSASEAWKTTAFAAVAALDLQKYFHAQGIPSCADEFGRLMPYTNSAKTIEQYIERYLGSSAVCLRTYADVREIRKDGHGFTVNYAENEETLSAQAPIVVCACGGSAYPQLGTDGSAFALLRKVGHTITPQCAGI